MNRRDAVGGLVVAGMSAAGAGAGEASAAPPPGQDQAAATGLPPPPPRGPRMNLAQADRVMTALGLDAIVVGDGVNFRQATGFRPVVTRMGFPPGAVAIVTRRPEARVVIVMADFSYYYTAADVHAGSGVPVYLYSATPWPEDPDAAAAGLFPDRGAVPLDAIERHRLAATTAAFDRHGAERDAAAALGRALRDLRVAKGRLAVDLPAVGTLAARGAPEATLVDADDALRRIRPVKSPVEIELMRYAASANVAAAREALGVVRAGGSYRELRAAFFAAAARRGLRGVFMVVDRASDEQFDATFRDGQALLIDCVAEYEGYHGDYGRTVFVGEPAREMGRATTAIAQAWDRVRAGLRPGLRFSEIRSLGATALADAGARFRVPFNPHSVGLYHTDHVGHGLAAPREDMVLEPGMVLSIDCPLIESGVGGSAHLEDLVLITADGGEAINDTRDPVIRL